MIENRPVDSVGINTANKAYVSPTSRFIYRNIVTVRRKKVALGMAISLMHPSKPTVWL